MHRASAIFGRVLDAMMLVACLLVLAMTLLIGLDVGLRNAGLGGVPWSNEVSEYILYLVTLLSAPWLLRAGQHIRVDILLKVLPPKLAWVLEWLADILGLVCSAYFVWYGVKVLAASYASGAISIKTLVLPEWWLLAPMPLAFVLVSIEFVFRMWRLANGPRAPATMRCRRHEPCRRCTPDFTFPPPLRGRCPAAPEGGRSRPLRSASPPPPLRATAPAQRRRGEPRPPQGGRGSAAVCPMSWEWAALLLLGGSTVLLFIGMPVALSFVAINIVGAFLFLGGEAGLAQVVRNSVVSVMSFALTPIPLFILMGEILFHTGLAIKVIEGVERLIRQVPGRLAIVAVVAGTVFSAISGSTIATTAMLGSLMVPVMLARGYHPTMAAGPIMAIGAVDMLIPPSALTVLLGSLSGISISKLLIGGVIPGPDAVGRIRRLHHRARATRSGARPADADREPRRVGDVATAAALRAAAGVDLRGRGRRDVGRLCDTDGIGGTRCARHDGACARLSRVVVAGADALPERHDGDLRHDPVHHPGRHDVLADPEFLRRYRRAGRGNHRTGPVAADGARHDDADFDLSGHLRRPGDR